MFGFKVIIVFSAIFAYCKSASIVDNIKKCELKDGKCMQNFFRTVIQGIGPEGIPDMGIPSIDPYTIDKLELNIMGMIKMDMTDGVSKGFKTCLSNKFHVDTEKLVTSIELTCDNFNVETNYKMESTPTLESLIGGIKIHGEGQGGITIEKIQFNFEIPFEVKKLEDCEIHLVIIPDRVTYTYQLNGKIQFHYNDLYIGKQEVSSVVTNIMNENYEFFGKTFAKSVTDVILEGTWKQCNKFLTAVPAKDIISDDLTPLVTI